MDRLLFKLLKKNLYQLAEFIVNENYSQHSKTDLNFDAYRQSLFNVLQEDVSVFDSSCFFTALLNSQIVGSVKVTKWDGLISLPIETMFKIDVLNFSRQNDYREIWHIGRFAVSRTEKDGAKLLKQLIALAIYPICKMNGSVMVAECDKKFVRGLNLLGIKTKQLGPGIEYLGSETIPIYSTSEWLRDFLYATPNFEQLAKFYENDLLQKNRSV